MAAIYAGAEVTIAAPTAEDSESGFLRPRFATRRVPSCKLRCRGGNGIVTGKIEVWYPAFSGRSYDVHRLENDSVLDTRGWILQERMLSSRVLYFGSQQLYFECNTGVYFEMLQYPVEQSFGSWDSVSRKKNVSNLDTGELFGWWLEIVANYTDRELTFPHDKLPPLSGIASLIQRATKGRYLAGLWREDLARGLLWSGPSSHSKPDYDLFDLNAPYRAPT